MLSNAYLLAKFRFDTAENEPAKNLHNFANFPNFALAALGGGAAPGQRASQGPTRGAHLKQVTTVVPEPAGSIRCIDKHGVNARNN